MAREGGPIIVLYKRLERPFFQTSLYFADKIRSSEIRLGNETFPIDS